MKTELDHLPEEKRRELARVTEILFEEFETVQARKTSARARSGKILKVILFGSYARGDWVDEAGKTAKGYQSDYDILIVVNTDPLTDMSTYWYKAEDRIIADKGVKTPIGLIAHTLADMNEKLAQGQYFFSDIVREGIALHEAKGHPFVEPKPLDAKEAYEIAKEYFEEWNTRAGEYFDDYVNNRDISRNSKAAFELHQAVEMYYAAYLLTTTSYSPSTHNLRKLRALTEDLDARFRAVWPDEDRFQRRAFERLKDAYVKARYSKHYKIAEDELEWLGARAETLATLVKQACEERLGELENAVGA
ncbi:MAG: HEPN domain-containing protein [Pseudomonadota bacterium]